MLGKLLKYDLKAMFKPMVVFYLITLITILATRLLYKITDISWTIELLFGLFAFASGLLIFILFIISVVIVVRRFVTNILKDEGYLTNTLPLSKSMLLASKNISATIVVIVSWTVGIILSIILAGGLSEFFTIITDILKDEEVPKSSLLLFGIIGIIQTFNTISTLNFSFTLGHAHSNNKVLFSIGYIFITYIITQIIVVILFTIFGILIDENILFSTYSSVTDANIILGGLIFIMLCGSAILFALTNFVLSNKLNLE